MSRGMSRIRDRALTLMELLISLVLLCLIVLGIANIDIFCKYVFVGSDRKSKIINEASYVVEHMSKFIGQAVGDANNPPVKTDSPPAYCTQAVRVQIDNISKVSNGIWDSDDNYRLYCFNNTSHSMRFYSNYTIATPGPFEELSHNVLVFNATPIRNTIEVNLTGCWNATITTGLRACGSVDNPSVAFQTRIFMSSVSINATSP
jgi:hypothetical protein